MGPLLPKTVISPFPPQGATVVTSQPLPQGPGKRSCASGTSGGALSLSHGLNGSARGASLAAVAAAMAVTGMVVAVVAIWEGAWPGGCEGLRGRAGRCAGEVRGCAVEGADGAASAELSRESSKDIRGVEKGSLHCNMWSLGARKAVETFRFLSAPACPQQVMP